MGKSLPYGSYYFANAEALRKDIGKSEYLSAVLIWETLSKSPRWEFRAPRVWARDSGLQDRTLARLVEKLKQSQAERGENNPFLAVESKGELIRFFSEDLKTSFDKREEKRAGMAKFREERKKLSKTSESFPENSETSEIFSESFENAIPQSLYPRGIGDACGGNVAPKTKSNQTKQNQTKEYVLEREGFKGRGEESLPGQVCSLGNVSDETVINAKKFQSLYPKKIDLGRLLKIWQENNLDKYAEAIFATIKENLSEGGKWHDESQKRYIPNPENFLTDENSCFDWQTRDYFKRKEAETNA